MYASRLKKESSVSFSMPSAARDVVDREAEESEERAARLALSSSIQSG